jgi:prepilin-type N-terminal cleavage/methylation domain-containing protein
MEVSQKLRLNVMLNFFNDKHKAFTLIELLVVIAIIGLLSSVVLVSMKGIREKAQIAKGLDFSNSIQNALGVDAVGVWRFETLETGNIVLDSSGNGNHGTVYGGTVPATGMEQLGNALQFDGVDDYVSVGSSAILSLGTFTVEWWMNASTAQPSAHGGVIAKDANDANEWKIYLHTSTNMRFVNTYSGTSVTLGDPQGLHHWVAIADGYSFIVYKDGQKVVDATMPAQTVANTQTLYVGRALNRGDLTWRYFSGFIDEVRIYETALNSAQVKSQYYAGLDKLLVKGLMSEGEYEQRLARN